jgi:two-component system, OmpR family, sensor kinase
MSLRTRLAVAVGAVMGVLVLVGLLLPSSVRRDQVDQLDSQLAATVPIAQRPPPSGWTDAAPQVSFSDIYFAFVADDGTRTSVVKSQLGGDREPDLADVEPTMSAFDTTQTVGSVDGDGEWRVMAVTRIDGQGWVALALPLDRVDATVTRLRWTIALAGTAVLSVLALGGWWVVRLGLQPIARMAEVADAITAGERSRRAPTVTPGTEAAHLARAFNVMLDERAATEERLRRFIADASHELRTPVAAIRGFTDLYRQGALGSDTERNDAMRRIGQEAARVGRLVDDLLLLARLDEGRPLERTSVDVAAILDDAALDASATHPTRTVDVDVHRPLEVCGDEERLRQVVANLVTNAMVHGGPHANVRLHAEQRDGACLIEVVDDGVGMSADAAARAFDRFWRSDPSRARHAGGAGLGLPIVRAIVEAHGGRIELHAAPRRGTTVSVTLPSAERTR